MDFKQIQELIKMINKSNIGQVTIEEGDFKITVKQKKDNSGMVIAPPVMPVAQSHVQQLSAAQPVAAVSAPKEVEVPTENLLTIKSPMIGTFYRKSSPDKPPFVDQGDEVAPGKIVCIIEAMKLFNEIESEVRGRIVKILVEDSSPVEFDQPLFLLEPL